MKTSPGETHKPRAIAPADFRAQATGIGQSLSASRSTGAARAQRVADTIPDRAAVPEAEGFPAALGAPSRTISGSVVSPVVASPVPLGKGY
jgi:phospholipase/lecithinase/hemolysin